MYSYVQEEAQDQWMERVAQFKHYETVLLLQDFFVQA